MRFLVMIFALLFSAWAFAQDAVAVMTDESFVLEAIEKLGGMKGLGTSAIVVIVVQLLISFLNTPLASKLLSKTFAKMNGYMKTAIVSGLTILVTFLTQMGSGASLVDVLLKGGGLALVTHYVYDLYSRKGKKK